MKNQRSVAYLCFPLSTSLTAVLCVALLFLSGFSTREPEPRRQVESPPNIVIILADDLGYGDTSPYGGWIETPHLERLAAEGIRFTDFHASGPVCTPTRAGLLTGRYQQRAGLERVIYANPASNRRNGLHPHEVTFARLLKRAGYATAVFGKWHLGYEKHFNPVHHGFDQFRGFVSGNVDYHSHTDRFGYYDWWDGDELVNEFGYTTHLITQHALEFIEANQHQPFCLYIAHEAPHDPYQGPEDEPFRIVGKANVPEPRDPEHVERAYREMVEELDKGVGQVVETLERLGLAENTLVFFFSDNGANQFGSNGKLRDYKTSLWEGGHRVPAIAWWPGRIEAGRTSDELAISLDLMPTMLDVAGVEVPEGHQLDGASLLPVLLNEGSLESRTLFWQYEGQASVRQAAWKLLVDAGGQEGVALYNLNDDLAETKNLAGEHPQRVETMQAALEAWRRDVSHGATSQPSP